MTIYRNLKENKKEYPGFSIDFEERLGDILIEEGLLSLEDLYSSLRIQKEQGGRLGWILVSNGYIKRIELYKALAKKSRLPFVSCNIRDYLKKLDAGLLSRVSPEEIIKYQAVPVSLKGNRLIVLTAYPNSKKTLQHYREKFDTEIIEERVVTDKDITEIVKKIFKRSLHSKVRFGLFHRKPEESAYRRVTKPQIIVLISVLAAISMGLWFYTDAVLIGIFGIIQVFYLIFIAYKFIISVAGIRHKDFKKSSKGQTCGPDHYPVYTVLVPLFKEPEPVVGSIISAIKDLDYPKNKLDIIFLFEKHDTDTLKIAKKLRPPSSWRFFIVPNGTPTTKPKACNYGLSFSRGEYLVIYDAEDIPEPDQLKKALYAFQNSPDDYGCFQAFLNYYNKDENFLTRMFTLEYTYWFDYLLSGLYKYRLPIPLGGTSNHFKIGVLKNILGWDPYNVTEDADLGIRMSAENKRVGVINSTTYEEANSRPGNWIRQRSRWIKGYIQTSLVYNRHPLKLIRTLGFKRWASFQMIVTGTPFTFLINPIMWLLFLVWIITNQLSVLPQIPEIITISGTISLIAGNTIMIVLNLAAAFSRKYYNLMPFALLNPFYWILHSVAAYKALWQFLFRPFYWEKTTHGLTNVGFGSASHCEAYTLLDAG